MRLLLSILAIASTTTAQSTAVWLPSQGGNGHTYEVRVAPNPVTWTAAQADAKARNGHLVTISSAAENAFVFRLIDAPQFWNRNPFGFSLGPWIGGFQTPNSKEPDGGWRWVTSEPMNYTNWMSGQPNNVCAPSEDHINFMANVYPARGSQWNDLSQGSCGLPIAYVIEYDVSLVMTQPKGPGTSLVLTNHGLEPRSEYFNVLSIEPCFAKQAPVFLGLCASTEVGVAVLISQLTLPIGVAPFHVIAPSATKEWRPLPVLPPITVDAICFQISGTKIGEVSRVVRYSIR